MGVIKSSFIRNLDKSSQVVVTHISSFIPSTETHPLLVNEANESAIDIHTNHQIETLTTDQEIDNLLNSEETDNRVDSQPEVKNIMLIGTLSTTPSTPKYPPAPTSPPTSALPPKLVLPSTPLTDAQPATYIIREIQSVDPNLTEDQLIEDHPSKEQHTEQ